MPADPSTARLVLFDIDGVFLAGKRDPRLAEVDDLAGLLPK